MSQLVTGDAVVLDLRTAGVPSRMVAASLDLLVQGVVMFLLFAVVGAVSQHTSAAAAAALSLGVLVLTLLGYPVVLETLLAGRTLGKMALGLRVVRDDGSPITFRHAITRGLIGMFVEKPGITMGSAAVITALVNEQGKRLGDLAAGTVVVQERVARAPSPPVVQMPPALAHWAAGLDLSALPDALAASASAYLGRYASLTPAVQHDLGNQLAGSVAALVTPPPPPGVPAWAYLSAVLAERRRRAYAGVAAYGGPGPTPPPAPPVVTPAPAPPADSPFAPPS